MENRCGQGLRHAELFPKRSKYREQMLLRVEVQETCQEGSKRGKRISKRVGALRTDFKKGCSLENKCPVRKRPEAEESMSSQKKVEAWITHLKEQVGGFPDSVSF